MAVPIRQIRRERRRICGARTGGNRSMNRALQPSARSDVRALHGDGRGRGRGPARSRRSPGDPHGNRPAGRRRPRRPRSWRRTAGLESGRIGYTPSLGIASLRARIARHYPERYGVEVDPARVVVTTGSSAGFMLAFLALFEPGDRVAIASPGYPPYRNILAALGCEAVAIEISPATRFALDRRGADRGSPRAGRSTACWSRAPPIRPAP